MNPKDRAHEVKAEDIYFGVSEKDVERLDDGSEWGKKIIGQPRALEALKLGLGIRGKGYNILASGAPGTGRRTAIVRALSEIALPDVDLEDIAYVYNFGKPLSPKVLRFPKGDARKFKRDIHQLVENVKKIVRLQTESESFRKTKQSLLDEVEVTENKLLADFEAELAKNGFQIIQIMGEDGQSATDISPVWKGERMTFDALHELVASKEMTEEDWNAKRAAYYSYIDRMKGIFEGIHRRRVELDSSVRKLKDETLRPLVSSEVRFVTTRYPGEKIEAWLCELERDILVRLYLFEDQSEGTPEPQKRQRSPALARYGVNVIVDHSDNEKIPVVFENHPTLANLFGSIEPHPDGVGDTRAAYLKIRAGSLLHADGGYVVLRAEDIVQDEESWTYLKRVLQTGKVEIPSVSGSAGVPPSFAKPEPVDVSVRVVMTGGESTYDILYMADPDFQKLFKVSAEFDSSMMRNDETTRDYISFIRTIAKDEKLLPVEPGAIARIIEYGVRLSEYRSRLSTRFGMIADLVRESDYFARMKGLASVNGECVTGAIAKRSYLSNLPEEKISQMIVAGEIILNVSGTAVGRLNGLAVHDRGYYAFGLPAVISAQVAPGESGVVNIEGESGLSGEIYDKAVLIVEGFLRSRYARDFPLAITASICFEQSYTAVEGDSASSTAIYALLSAISGIPLRQDIAVTGSLNQMGQVQPVGGVNEKIEGFFRICKQIGFSGSQGAMIPRQNLINLTLSPEVQEAVERGDFHIWAVSSIDEGIEVLTGMNAGAMNERGDFPSDSFNHRVRKELYRMAKTIKTYLS